MTIPRSRAFSRRICFCATRSRVMSTTAPIARAGSQRSSGGCGSPGRGRPSMTSTATPTVRVPAQNISCAEMRRPSYLAARGRVNMSDSTRMGCTTSRVPNPSATTCSPYPSRAVPVPAHHRGRETAFQKGEPLREPSAGASSAMRWRTTVPHAMVRAEASANSTASRLLCTQSTIVNAPEHAGWGTRTKVLVSARHRVR